jgi:hypothetical protein
MKTTNDLELLDALAGFSDLLAAEIDASRLPLPLDDQERIEQLTARITGLRRTLCDVNAALQHFLRIAGENV